MLCIDSDCCSLCMGTGDFLSCDASGKHITQEGKKKQFNFNPIKTRRRATVDEKAIKKDKDEELHFWSGPVAKKHRNAAPRISLVSLQPNYCSHICGMTCICIMQMVK